MNNQPNINQPKIITARQYGECRETYLPIIPGYTKLVFSSRWNSFVHYLRRDKTLVGSTYELSEIRYDSKTMECFQMFRQLQSQNIRNLSHILNMRIKKLLDSGFKPTIYDFQTESHYLVTFEKINFARRISIMFQLRWKDVTPFALTIPYLDASTGVVLEATQEKYRNFIPEVTRDISGDFGEAPVIKKQEATQATQAKNVEHVEEIRLTIDAVNQSHEIKDGTYTIVMGEIHKTLKFKTYLEGKFANKTIVSYLAGNNNESDYIGCAFYNHDTGAVNVWGRHRNSDMAATLSLAIQAIRHDPSAAGLAYALESNRCYRCGRRLTVEASICRGLGPQCAQM